MKQDIQLQKGWKWIKVGEICEVVTGTTPPKSDPSNYGKVIPFFKPPHLWDGSISETVEMLSLKGSQKARVVPPNTVLVTCIGNLGRTGFVKKEAAFNQQINAILENKEIEGKFIFYQAQSPLFRKQLEKLATGTTVSIVNKSNFETIKIPVPPKPTQQAIVTKIEELFSELDKGIENLRLAQQQLKTYRQSVLKWAFEGKLTNTSDNITNNRNHKIDLLVAAEEESKYQLQNKEIWKLKRLGDMFDFVGGGTPSKNEKSYWNGNIFWASVKDIKGDYLNNTQDTITEKGLKNSASNLAQPGDVILITRISPGKSIIVNIKSAINQDLKIAKPKFKTSPKFINYFFNSIERDCLKKASGTTVLGITLNNLNELEIPDLNLFEQNKIVQGIESRLSVADKMEESITQSLQQAEGLRQSILKKAFEGKLV